MNTNQRSQPVKESTRVRRNVKIGSRFKITLLTIKSDKRVTAKKEIPSSPLYRDGKSKKVATPIPTMQIVATAKRVFFRDGKENMDE